MRRDQKLLTARSSSTRRVASIAAVLLAACCGLSVSAAAALAAPGTTVETAGLLTTGVTVSGNTASETVIGHGLSSAPACTKDEQLWKVNLIAGDKVTLHGAEEAPANGFIVEAVPPGATNAELLGTSQIPGVDEGSLEGGLTFAAPRTGTWLIIVGPACDGRDGPYQLSAAVTPPAFIAGPGGGNTTENAPLLTPGVTVSGNTAADDIIGHGLSAAPACTKDEELWTLNLIAGDKVTLQGAEEAPANGFIVEAVPPGTSDATLLGTASIAGVDEGSLEGGLTFAAPRTGTWLIIVGPACDGRDGPYQLSAAVTPPAFIAGPGGGNTTENAPLLTPGVTVSGNTAADDIIGHNLNSDSVCTKDEELWTLNLIAGDKVTLQGAEEAPANGFIVEAVPPGTSDATLLGTASIAGVDEGSLEGGLTFAAPRTGTWLIIVGPACDGRDGPYKLSAKLIPVLPRFTSLVFPARVLRTGRAATLRLTLSEPSTVRVSVSQILTGHRLHGSCSEHARRGRACSFEIHRTTFTFAGVRGRRSLALPLQALRRGSYSATVTAEDSLGRMSRPATWFFRIT